MAQAISSRLEPSELALPERSPSRSARRRTSSPAAQVASVAAPLASALAGALLVGNGGRAKPVGLALLGASLGALLTRWQLGRVFHPQPAFVPEGRQGRLELRRYAPHLRAATWVEASTWSEALSDGFQRLAGYVFGENDREERLPMTTPVLLSMPASGSGRHPYEPAPPVVTSLARLTGPAARQMSFVMPSGHSLDDLPLPNDRRISLSSAPARRVAALAFRGLYGGDLPAQKRNELLFLVKCAGLRPTSEVWFAAYDGPTTLPFLRHSEVLVEVED